jgi:hypothetical protein
MKKIQDFLKRCKYSQESVYIFAEMKNKKKFHQAMQFHIMKNIVVFGIVVLACQILLLILLGVI